METTLPNIAIVGQCGSGKTYSLRNLTDAVIIDTERKGLPFRNKTGLQVFTCVNLAQVDEALKTAANDPKVKVVVLDSFTKYCEFVLAAAQLKYRGFDVWTYHNMVIRNLLELLKGNKINVIVGIDEIVHIETPEGGRVSRVNLAVPGKAWEGKVEKEFLIVFHCFARRNNKIGKVEHWFQCHTDGITSAKCPDWLGYPDEIPNDLQPVIERIYAEYGVNKADNNNNKQ